MPERGAEQTPRWMSPGRRPCLSSWLNRSRRPRLPVPGRVSAQPPAPGTVRDIWRSAIAIILLLPVPLLGVLFLLDLLFRALVLLLLHRLLLRTLPHAGSRTHARILAGWHVGQPHASFGSTLLHLLMVLLSQRLALLGSLQAAHLVAIRPALGRSHQLGTIDRAAIIQRGSVLCALLIPLHHAACRLADRCGLATSLAAALVGKCRQSGEQAKSRDTGHENVSGSHGSSLALELRRGRRECDNTRMFDSSAPMAVDQDQQTRQGSDSTYQRTAGLSWPLSKAWAWGCLR